jgi:hypothetical protein
VTSRKSRPLPDPKEALNVEFADTLGALLFVVYCIFAFDLMIFMNSIVSSSDLKINRPYLSAYVVPCLRGV